MKINAQPPAKRQKTNQLQSFTAKSTFSKSIKLSTEKSKSTKTSSYSQKLERLSATNPNFYSLLKDSNLISSSSSVDVLAESRNNDEEEIRRLEKKLGIKSAGKLTKAFGKDGLDGIEFINFDVFLIYI
jgi:hypothetical protein